MKPRPVTLCLAYYDNPKMLEIQVANLRRLPEPLREAARLIVVDDASPRWPAALPADLPFPASLFRMREDIPWNQDACRNLAVEQAESEWVLLTDMDHLPPERLWQRIMTGPLDPANAYTFARVTAPRLEPYKPHPNSWLMTRDLYNKAGGYDERYAGIYGTDGKFRKQVQAVAQEVGVIKEALHRYPREYVADASTTTLERKSDHNAAAKAKVDAQLAAIAAEATRPLRGRFKWDRVS